jgi:hypothetical protein
MRSQWRHSGAGAGGAGAMTACAVNGVIVGLELSRAGSWGFPRSRASIGTSRSRVIFHDHVQGRT